VLDTRGAEEFDKGFVPGSINLSLTMNYAIWAGTLFPPGSKFFIIAEAGKEKEAVLRLARIGYDHCVGVLDGGIDAYKASGKPMSSTKTIAAADVRSDLTIYDVRNPGEVAQGHVEGC
jgi:rhodanese-related sulfurtransferase